MRAQALGVERPAVLVVEREDEVREQLTNTLRWSGYEVLSARDGHEAHGLWNDGARTPAAVVLDVSQRMPGALRLYVQIRAAARQRGTYLLLNTDDPAVDAPEGNALLHRPLPVVSVAALLQAHVPVPLPPDHYQVRVAGAVSHALARLPERERAWFADAFDRLREQPRPTCAVWAGVGQYRLSCGEHWARYAVDDHARTVALLELGRRAPR